MDSPDQKRDRVLKAALACRVELMAYARSLTGNYSAADDVVQEAINSTRQASAAFSTRSRFWSGESILKLQPRYAVSDLSPLAQIHSELQIKD